MESSQGSTPIARPQIRCLLTHVPCDFFAERRDDLYLRCNHDTAQEQTCRTALRALRILSSRLCLASSDLWGAQSYQTMRATGSSQKFATSAGATNPKSQGGTLRPIRCTQASTNSEQIYTPGFG